MSFVVLNKFNILKLFLVNVLIRLLVQRLIVERETAQIAC